MGFWGPDTTPTKPQSSGGFWSSSPSPAPAPKPAPVVTPPPVKTVQPKDNSFWGIAKNTVLGIPKAIGTVAKTDAGLLKEAGGNVAKIADTVFPGVKQVAKGVKTGDFSDYKAGFSDTLPTGPLTYKDSATGKIKVNDAEAKKVSNLVMGFTGAEGGAKKVAETVTGLAEGAARRVPSAAEKLMAEGKVRLVQRDGVNAYQVKAGDFWKPVANEAEAVAKAGTPKAEPFWSTPKEPAALSTTKTPIVNPVKPEPFWSEPAKPAKITTQPLAEEARKYASADEFINAQKPVYHGTNQNFDSFKDFRETEPGWLSKGHYFATDLGEAKGFGNNIKEGYLKLENPYVFKKDIINKDGTITFSKSPKEQIFETFPETKDMKWGDVSEYLQKKGYDGIENGSNVVAFDPNKSLKTEGQLRDLHNLASKTDTPKASLKRDANGMPLALTKREREIVARADQQSNKTESLHPQPKISEAPPSLSRDGNDRPLSENTKTATKALSESEARSLETLAQAQGPDIHLPPREANSSLERMLEQTPVKNKVNILDGLRTPDRVLKKMGLGREVETLRAQHEAYRKELPKNIEKITAWMKEAGPDSSTRIFKYLDGQQVLLAPKEQKVATEIKNWLAEWADRLRLPGSARITNYITHLFDDQLIKKEFDEDLAKIIADKIPGEVYNPFLAKRLGKRGYKQDVWAALDAYAKRATRKVHMDVALERMEVAAERLEKSQFDYVKSYVNHVNMRPTDIDTKIDNGIKSIVGYKLGQRPTLVTTRWFRKLAYRSMLGLNPGSALRNLSQGINTYATLGEKYTTIGYSKLFSPAAHRELTAEGILDSNIVGDRSISAVKKTMETVDKGLFAMFDTVERINRGAAYFGGKSKYIAENMRLVKGQEIWKQGTSMEKAIEYGKEIVRKTQFDFSSIDTPLYLQSDIMKTLGQFQSYTTKQLEFLTELRKDKTKVQAFAAYTRYAASGLLFVYTVGKAFGMKPEELIPTYRFDVPPSLRVPFEIGKAALNVPDKYGSIPDLKKKAENIGGAVLTTMVPGGSQIKKTFQAAQAIKEGGSFSSNGNLNFEVGGTATKDAQALFFGKYSSPGAKEYFNKAPSPEEKRLQPVYDQVQQLVAEGKKDEATAIVNALADDEYTTYKKIKAAANEGKSKNMIPVAKQVQALVDQGKTEEAQAIVDDLPEEDYKAYKKAKTQLKENPVTDTSESSFIDDVATYAHAIGTDPVTAFNRIFTGQRIRRVDGGSLFGNAIIVDRMPFSESQKVKGDGGGNNPSMKLDHTIPLELGGSNDKSNLKLVTTAEWKANSPLENHLGKLLRDKKISKKEAQTLITQYKNGEITADDILTRN